MAIRLTWGPKKAKLNLKRHGVRFETGAQVFDDPFVLIVEDREDENGEMRYHAIGRAHSQTLLVIVHVDRSTDEQTKIRIISARAEDNEESAYSDQLA